ncbi:MAG: two-component system response regulator [Sandaracinaceae bacterium]
MPKVLLVDDDAPHTRITRLRLEKAGFHVEISNRSYGVLNLIAASQPDVVLLDMEMPGLNGLELLDLLREDDELARTRVVFYSGMAETELRARAEATGTAFAHKMGEFTQLLQVLRAA